MKKISIVLGFLFLSLTVVADDHAPNILGLETYACNFNEGNDLQDSNVKLAFQSNSNRCAFNAASHSRLDHSW